MDAERLEPLRWWRVELNKAGTVTSCEPVENCERNSRSVIYFKEVCREHALESATRWLERRRAWARAYEKRRRAKKRERGQCESCNRKVCAGSKNFCATHLAAAREFQRAYQASPDKGHRLVKITDPIEAMARDEARRQRHRRMTVQLPVVFAVFDQLDGRLSSPFRRWLVDEIAARGGRTAEAAE